MDFISDIGAWLAALEPAFAFLLALPFAVAAAGLFALHLERRAPRRERRVIAPPAASHRPVHVR
jgi:hypothetical protein